MRIVDLTLEPVYNLLSQPLSIRLKNAEELAQVLETKGWDEDQAWAEARAAHNLPNWEQGKHHNALLQEWRKALAGGA